VAPRVWVDVFWRAWTTTAWWLARGAGCDSIDEGHRLPTAMTYGSFGEERPVAEQLKQVVEAPRPVEARKLTRCCVCNEVLVPRRETGSDRFQPSI
jgi:hypothetical protein